MPGEAWDWLWYAFGAGVGFGVALTVGVDVVRGWWAAWRLKREREARRVTELRALRGAE